MSLFIVLMVGSGTLFSFYHRDIIQVWKLRKLKGSGCKLSPYEAREALLAWVRREGRSWNISLKPLESSYIEILDEHKIQIFYWRCDLKRTTFDNDGVLRPRKESQKTVYVWKDSSVRGDFGKDNNGTWKTKNVKKVKVMSNWNSPSSWNCYKEVPPPEVIIPEQKKNK